MPTPYLFNGKQTFKIVGSGLHEDTIRIEAKSAEKERRLKLILPTLCITYAQMDFVNKIGGEQKNYPASASYGPAYFDPPVQIDTTEKIEKLTWIRGADRVIIGKEITEVSWSPWRTLVIPRLRIERDKPADGSVEIENFTIPTGKELAVDIMQFADGRHVGGAKIVKRHPEWNPPVVAHVYELSVRVIDAATFRPFPKVAVNIFRWETGKKAFAMTDKLATDENGSVYLPSRQSDELEAVTVGVRGAWARVRCYRPLPGEKVRLNVRIWKLDESNVSFIWKAGINIESLCLIAGSTPKQILVLNNLKDQSELIAGMKIIRPCWKAVTWLQEEEKLNKIAEKYAFGEVERLLEANKSKNAAELEREGCIQLPGWNFFYAGKMPSLPDIDRLFSLPPGSSRTVGKVFHPDNAIPYEMETLAVPTMEFRKTNDKFFG